MMKRLSSYDLFSFCFCVDSVVVDDDADDDDDDDDFCLSNTIM